MAVGRAGRPIAPATGPLMGALAAVVDRVSLVIGAAGGLVIIYGAVVTAYKVLRVELPFLRVGRTDEQRYDLRHEFGYFILLGLEFLVAADILYTLLHPDVDELLRLGALVLIRTVVSVSLHWELSKSDGGRG